MTNPSLGTTDYYEDDSVKISFSINSTLYFILENKLDDRIYIEWENARTNDSRVILGTDSKLTYRNKKEDEAVSAKSHSIEQCFFKDASPFAGSINGWAEPLVDSWQLKRGKNAFVEILIPIRFPDGKTKDYKFTFIADYKNPADVTKISVGMKDKEVKTIVGTPDKKEKNKDTKAEKWQYINNAIITFEKGIVTNVEYFGK